MICKDCRRRESARGLTRCDTCRERRREFDRARRRAKRAKGICHDCPRRVARGRSRCRFCLAARKRAKEAKAVAGICRECSRRALRGRSRCRRHLDLARARMARQKADADAWRRYQAEQAAS